MLKFSCKRFPLSFPPKGEGDWKNNSQGGNGSYPAVNVVEKENDIPAISLGVPISNEEFSRYAIWNR